MKKLLSSLVLFGALVGSAYAQEIWPIDFGLVDLIHRPADVVGLRLGIPYGQNNSITGIDIGLYGQSEYAWALQFNLTSCQVRDEMGGLQVSLLNGAGHLTGMQIGLWNVVTTSVEGFQIGLLNLADDVTGMQIGVVNRTETMHGYQIGLVNVIRQSPLPCTAVINFAF